MRFIEGEVKNCNMILSKDTGDLIVRYNNYVCVFYSAISELNGYNKYETEDEAKEVYRNLYNVVESDDENEIDLFDLSEKYIFFAIYGIIKSLVEN